jgi:hypothetical protein
VKRGAWRVTAFGWALAVIVPTISAAGAYLWAGLTTSAFECGTGSGGSEVGIVLFWLLVVAAPVAIGCMT